MRLGNFFLQVQSLFSFFFLRVRLRIFFRVELRIFPREVGLGIPGIFHGVLFSLFLTGCLFFFPSLFPRGTVF